ncbi:uncharacterized protein LOC135093569 isoform X1 [Scylla paramamosain]|uniref:uncharacterized protein LOC135093569 isoform X1 n=2 Tax=Scylla paramamosain TaxID=85552 RepID=UPI0030829C93
MASAQPHATGWRARAPKRPPMTLRRLSHSRLTSLLTGVLNHPSVCPKNVATVGFLLRSYLPLGTLTTLLKDVTSAQDLTINPEFAVNLLRLNLNADVSHVEMKGRGTEANNLLERECETLMKEIEVMKELRLESLLLEGLALKPGLLSCVLRKAPLLRSLQLSGSLAEEALDHLSHSPCELHTLHLHSCTVTDEQIASALLWPVRKLSNMADVICSDEDFSKPGRVQASSLREVTVISPALTVGGAMVLLRALPHLCCLHYTWLVPVCESLRILQQLCPSVTSYAISHIDLSLVGGNVLESVASLCPGLRSLQIEGCEPSVVNLDALAGFTKLTSLTLRLVPEPFIVSAVKAVGHNLLKLRVEYEECVCKLFSFAALKVLQEHCRDLQSLELISVCLSGEPRPRQRSKIIAPAFPELTHLVVEGAASSPDVLASLISRNRALEHMTLAVNRDVLTDQVVSTLLSQNDLHCLATLHLGAGNLSPAALTTLLTLPSLSGLSLDLKRFPFIPESTFMALQDDLRSSNCLCRLDRSAVE